MDKNLYLAFSLVSILIIACKKQGPVSNKPENIKESKSLHIANLPDYWQDITVFEFNREDSRSDFNPFETSILARSNALPNSKNYSNLNGFWKFKYYDSIAAVPSNLFEQKNNDWTEISVPSAIELKSFGKPIYKFSGLPFVDQFPACSSQNNSVCVFKKIFSVPSYWNGKDIFVTTEQLPSAAYILVNNKLAGYTEDSKSFSEFLISPYLNKDLNEITIVTLKYADGTYFDGSNRWFFNGILGNVALFARPKLRIKDFSITTDLTNNYKSGEANINVKIKNNSDQNFSNHKITLSLFSDSLKQIWSSSKDINLLGNQEMGFDFQAIVSDITAWDVETPKLYDLIISLSTTDNTELEAIDYKIGFTKIEKKSNTIYLNGKKIKIKGVARHEHHPVTACIVDDPWMDNDVDLMKLNNINAVKNYHPVNQYWYNVTKKYGLYVFESPNISENGLYQKGNMADSMLHKNFLFRIDNMYQRHKNHPQILAWNNCINADKKLNDLFISYFSSKDQHRLIAINKSNKENSNNLISLYKGNTSTNTAEIFLGDPIISNFGNTLGGFSESWSNVINNNNVLGGFVEDWCDQTFLMKKSNGATYWGYGGCFGEFGSDSNLCVRGLLTANKTPKASYFQIKNAFKPFTFIVKNFQDGVFELQNNSISNKPKRFQFFWNIEEDGEKIKEGKLDSLAYNIIPSKSIKINYKPINFKPGKKYYLNFITQEIVFERGFYRYVIRGIEQFEIQNPLPALQENQKAFEKVELQDNKDIFIIKNKNFTVEINKSNGLIYKYQYQKKSLINNAIQPYFYRAPTGANLLFDDLSKSMNWSTYANHLKLLSIEPKPSAENIQIECKYSLENPKAELIIRYTFYNSEAICLNADLKFTEPVCLPRFGFAFEQNSEFSSLEWFGRGQQESYPDRKNSLMFGRYKNTIRDLYWPSPKPQETANKSDLVWASTKTFDDVYLSITDEKMFNLTALPFHYDLLSKPTYSGYDILAGSNNFIIIDQHQLPLGNGLQSVDCQNFISDKYHFSCRLKAIMTHDKNLSELILKKP